MFSFSDKSLRARGLGIIAVVAGLGSSAQAAPQVVFAHLEKTERAASDVFEKTLYSYVHQSETCYDCHGSGTGPQFADDNVTKAYEIAKKYLKPDPKKATFVIRSRNGHCGLDLCRTDGKDVMAAIEKWKEGDPEAFPKEEPKPNRLITQTYTVPAELGETYRRVRFDLSKGTPARADLEGVYFEVEMRRLAGNGLVIRKPRVATAKVALQVKQIELLVGGQPLPGDSPYRTIDRTVNPVAFSVNDEIWPNPVLSTAAEPLSMAMLKDLGETSATPEIQFQFEAVAVVAAEPGCRKIDRFREVVKPVMADRNCVFCHSGANSFDAAILARKRIDFSAMTDEALCAAAKQRMAPQLGMMLQSPWVALPALGFSGHAKVIPTSDLATTDWMNWMREEMSAKEAQ